MKKKKLNLAEVQKILEAVTKGKFPNLPEEIVKEAMKLLMDSIMASHKQQAAAPPSERPEPPCPWRQSDELQEIRLRVEEPSRVEYPIVKYLLRPTVPFGFREMSEAEMMKPVETGQLEKKMFVDGGARFWAWTADGKTPIFPIPL